MSDATKLSEYLGFEVVYLDGFAYIQEEGTNGPEIKRGATLEERTLWTELEHVSAELASLKAAMGEPVAQWKRDTKDGIPMFDVDAPTDYEQSLGWEPLYAISKDKP